MTRNAYILLAIAAIGAGVLVYIIFGNKQSAVVVSTTTSAPAQTFLPNGPQLDTKPFDDQRFKLLQQPQYPQVQHDEIGNPNPFVVPPNNPFGLTSSTGPSQPTASNSLFAPTQKINPFAGSPAVSNPPQK